jgi:acetolactate synthase-1/2/3 large subunit
VIQVDADPRAFRIDLAAALPIQADAAAFLEDLVELVGPTPERSARAAWLDRVHHDRQAWRERYAHIAAAGGSGGPMRPEAVLAAINTLAPVDATVVADTGYAAAWSGALIDMKKAGHGYLRADGSLGWAFPAALGVQLARPGSRVIVVIGDGGIGYHLGEIETALRLNLPVVVVILNNRSLAFEYHVQSLLYGEVVGEVDDFRDIDYGRIARSFGARGVRVTTAPEFEAAFAKALEGHLVTFIDAVVDREAIGPVTRYDNVRTRAL